MHKTLRFSINNLLKIMVLFIILIASLACGLFESLSGQQIKDGLTEDYSPSSAVVMNNSFSYSADQLGVQQDSGKPTRFTILFSENIRQETWFYDTVGYTVVFRNGVKVSDKTMTPKYQDEMYATTYSPDQFYNGMGLDEIVISTGKNDFMLTSVDGMAASGRLMHLEGLSIGLLDGQVNFVETYPAMTEIKLEAEDFSSTKNIVPEQTTNESPQKDIAPPINLTKEEAANQGVHKYLQVIYVDGELLDERDVTLEITFFERKVRVTENDVSSYYDQIDLNRYLAGDDSFMQLTFIGGGFIRYLEGDEGDIETLNSLLE